MNKVPTLREWQLTRKWSTHVCSRLLHLPKLVLQPEMLQMTVSLQKCALKEVKWQQMLLMLKLTANLLSLKKKKLNLQRTKLRASSAMVLRLTRKDFHAENVVVLESSTPQNLQRLQQPCVKKFVTTATRASKTCLRNFLKRSVPNSLR